MQTDTSTADDVRQSAEETASTLIDQAQQVASTQVSTQKERAASALDAVAQTLHDTGSGMREQQPQIASLAEQAAGRVEDVSNYVRQHEMRDMIGQVESLARREPVLFLGAAFAIGFVAARFMKASSPTRFGDQRRGQQLGRSDYGSGSAGYGNGMGGAAHASAGMAYGSPGAAYGAPAAGYPSGVDAGMTDIVSEIDTTAGDESLEPEGYDADRTDQR